MSARASSRARRGGAMRRTLAWLGAWAAMAGVVAVARAADRSGEVAGRDVDRGRELFTREWVPGDPAGHPGDGLGPMYNDTSCVACHNQGGVGGGGPSHKNVDHVTAVVTPVAGEPGQAGGPSLLGMIVRRPQAPRTKAAAPARPRTKGEPADRSPLIKLHAGFRDASNLVVHRFGLDADHAQRRSQVLNPHMAPTARQNAGIFTHSPEMASLAMQMERFPVVLPVELGHFILTRSQRNPAPLFGAGLIDAIPDAVLEAAAAQKDLRFPEVQGRVCRLDGGRIGRFGWKADQASLEDFVLTACAVELGLEVPGRHQGIRPDDPDYRSPGLDLTRDECDALTAFVRSLPAPTQRTPATRKEAEAIGSGRAAFDRIGCAACHRPRLGSVDGIYSDLLLHDLGETLGGNGTYGSFLPDTEESGPLADAGFPSGLDAFAGGPPSPRPAKRKEWRTPPLWGIRDSGPYLHDGRAETLEQAIALHDGEARWSRTYYFRLSNEERVALETFLKSLVAPGTRDAGRAAAP